MDRAGSQRRLISGPNCFLKDCKTIVGILKEKICYTENRKCLRPMQPRGKADVRP